jgi:hypothetical protein
MAGRRAALKAVLMVVWKVDSWDVTKAGLWVV